jgi:hypothetical protein
VKRARILKLALSNEFRRSRSDPIFFAHGQQLVPVQPP